MTTVVGGGRFRTGVRWTAGLEPIHSRSPGIGSGPLRRDRRRRPSRAIVRVRARDAAAGRTRPGTARPERKPKCGGAARPSRGRIDKPPVHRGRHTIRLPPRPGAEVIAFAADGGGLRDAARRVSGRPLYALHAIFAADEAAWAGVGQCDGALREQYAPRRPTGRPWAAQRRTAPGDVRRRTALDVEAASDGPGCGRGARGRGTGRAQVPWCDEDAGPRPFWTAPASSGPAPAASPSSAQALGHRDDARPSAPRATT